MAEITFTLSSPITEEEWDMITDVDFDHTNEITFHTKHGKEVNFIKQPHRLRGRWVETERRGVLAGAKYYKCDICAQAIVVIDSTPIAYGYNYCPRCGSQMEEGQDG